jgi:hypothetical protein
MAGEKPEPDLRIADDPLRLLHELQVHQIEAGKLTIEETVLPADMLSNPEGERIPYLLLAEDDPTIRQVIGLMFTLNEPL